MISTSDFRRGMKIEIDGVLYEIATFEHHKPGKGRAIVRARLKNLKDGRMLEKTFTSGDQVGSPDFEQVEVQFMYSDGDTFHFMNTSSYEQLELHKDFVGDAHNYLLENTKVGLLFHNGKPVTLDLPYFVNLKIAQTDPGFKGDTATGATKNATMETGLTVQVPLFMKEGDVLKIDTRTGEYVERISS